jgi:type IV pilus assembly protein PilE
MKDLHNKGITLLELMIVVAIISILAAIVYPSFKDSIRKARRADAIASLQGLQLEQVKLRANSASYSTSTSDVGYPGGTSNKGWYTIDISTASATDFLARATPQDDQAEDKCGVFAVDLNGPVAGTKPARADDSCWNIHN